jgi:hypothetical protein
MPTTKLHQATCMTWHAVLRARNLVFMNCSWMISQVGIVLFNAQSQFTFIQQFKFYARPEPLQASWKISYPSKPFSNQSKKYLVIPHCLTNIFWKNSKAPPPQEENSDTLAISNKIHILGEVPKTTVQYLHLTSHKQDKLRTTLQCLQYYLYNISLKCSNVSRPGVCLSVTMID